MKNFHLLFRSPRRLVLALLLGILAAWILRGDASLLLLGRDFAGRSLPVQLGLLAAVAMAGTLFWLVFLHYYGEPLAGVLKGIPAWLTGHPEITLILFLSFTARMLLADWNSYWYDELVSVKLLAADRSSLLDVFRTMVTGDRNPPLYQMALYIWIQLFGSSELATRMLSALYVTLATLFMYLFTEELFGKRPAVAAALFFNLSNMAVYYSLESRCFAQALFLSVLSAYTLARYLRNLQGDFSWKAMFLNRWFVVTTVVNLALLMTMYYNAFVLLAQAVFMLIYLGHPGRWRALPSSFLKTAAFFLFPLLLFLAVWGGAILQLFTHMGGGLDASAQPAASLTDLYSEYVVRPNFRQPGAALVILLLSLLALPALRLPEKDSDTKEYQGERNIFRLFTLCWAFLPLVFASLSFFVVQPPILYARYFICCTPPLMLLVVLGLEQLVGWLDRLTVRLHRQSAWGHYTRNALLLALLAAAVLVLPRGYDAAVTRKHDWRGTARQLVNLAANDPEKDYAVIETSHRDTPLLDFYLARYSPYLRAAGVLMVSEENDLASGEISQPAFLQSTSVAQSDYLVVAYIHFRRQAFPQANALLDTAYPVRLSMLDSEGRGYVVYDLKPDNK